MVLIWFISFLCCRNQSVFLGYESAPSSLKCGVPPGLLLGPLFFTSIFFTQLASHLSIEPLIPFFADDSQLHNSSFPSDFPAIVHILKDCIEVSLSG